MDTERKAQIDAARNQARAMAAKEATAGWAVTSFLFPVLVIIVAHVRSPRVSVAALAAWAGPDEFKPIYEAAFIEALKSSQVINAWVGGVFGFIIGFFLFSLILSGQ